MRNYDDLKAGLKVLDVPEHRPGFWTELDARLREESGVGGGRLTPKRRGWLSIKVAAAGAAAVLLFLVVSPGSLTSAVLAYSYPEGTHTYSAYYLSVPDPESTEAHGTLTYTVEENAEERTTTVSVQTNISDISVDCGHPTCPEDLALFSDIPVVRYVLDSSGGFVQEPVPDRLEEFPELVLPNPLPGSNLYVGLPFGFGPPFPEHPLTVGDAWATSGSQPRGGGSESTFSAEHTVVDQATIAGRDTMVIQSEYHTETGGGGFPITSKVKVWFDPVAGMIVRAELDYTMTATSGEQIGAAIRIEVELIDRP